MPSNHKNNNSNTLSTTTTTIIIIPSIHQDREQQLTAQHSRMQTGEGGGVTDDDIHEALHEAAEVGNVEACRLLWGKLSRRGRRRYFTTLITGLQSPLHAAVRNGHFEIVRLFIEEFKWNVNQKDADNRTPLYYARSNEEMIRFLLENGADVNETAAKKALSFAVQGDNTAIVRLVLEYGAGPNVNRRPANEEVNAIMLRDSPRYIDRAIMHGNADMVRMLLEHGSFVGHGGGEGSSMQGHTFLNFLLLLEHKDRPTKLSICRILMEHAKEDRNTAVFLQASFKIAVQKTTSTADNNNSDNNNEACHILHEAGIDTRTSMYCAIRAENLSICKLLVREYQVDPFLKEDGIENGKKNHKVDTDAAASPFLAAARQSVDTGIFEYFLDLWDEQFSSNGGKNNDGDCPLHVVCSDSWVSLRAIKVMVNRHADVLTMVDGEHGLLPFHFAVMSDASLDVIFYLLQQCPSALHHVGDATSTAAPVAASDPSSFPTTEHRNHHLTTMNTGFINDQIITAVKGGDLVSLRAFIAVVEDDDIDNALYFAAATGCSLESCRLLWQALSRRGKQKYRDSSDECSSSRRCRYQYQYRHALHVAVMNGHLEIVLLFIEDFKWNVNQKDADGNTPLYYARTNGEMTRYLLEQGADTNRGCAPLRSAVEKGSTEIVCLLLQYGADPNRAHPQVPAILAIRDGNAEILSMLLKRGAVLLTGCSFDGSTSLNKLLQRPDVSRETKVSIGHILVKHARVNKDAATLMRRSLEYAIKEGPRSNPIWYALALIDSCEILIQTGIMNLSTSSRWVWDCAIQEKNEPICRLLVQYGADPFFSEDDNQDDQQQAVTPFLAAARQADTRIFEFLLGVWDERFSSTGGKNMDGDYPLHLVCSNSCVSLQAIQVLVNRHAGVLLMVDGEQGLLPFYFAAMSDASLDVIFYLLQQCPSAALHHHGGMVLVRR